MKPRDIRIEQEHQNRVVVGNILEGIWESSAGDALRTIINLVRDTHAQAIVGAGPGADPLHLAWERGFVAGLDRIPQEIGQCIRAAREDRDKLAIRAEADSRAADAVRDKVLRESGGRPQGPGV